MRATRAPQPTACRAAPALRTARRVRAPLRVSADAAPPGKTVVCLGEGLFGKKKRAHVSVGSKRERKKERLFLSRPPPLPPPPFPLSPDFLADQKGLPRPAVTSWTPYPGGAPANVAAAVATLGHPAAFVSALGKDSLGDDLVSLLASKGVDVTGVQRVPAPTRDVYVVFTKDGDRSFVGFGAAAADEYADCFIDAHALPLDMLTSAGALITGTLGLAYPKTGAAMEAAVAAAAAGGAAVVIDVNWRPVFFDDPAAAPSIVRPYVDRADIVKLAEEEAEWLVGVPAARALDAPDAVLAALPRAAGVLVTGGGAGCAYAFKSPTGGAPTCDRVPAYPVSVEDTTGAGDAFLGGFVAAALDAGGLEAVASNPAALCAAVEFGAAAGALTATAPGAIDAQPTRDRVVALLKQNK